MIFEGLKLTVLGMSVVFIFLVLLVFIIKLNSRLCRKATLMELKALDTGESAPSSEVSGNLIAIITAAIKKHKYK